MILLGASLFFLPAASFRLSMAQSDVPQNTFSDPNTGLTLSYPSGWNTASQDYLNQHFGQQGNPNSSSSEGSSATSSTSGPIVMVLPTSLDGSSVVVLSEDLPSPMTVDKYIEITKSHLTSISMSEPIPVAIANTNGLKYNISLPDGGTQTQIAFIKDSQAFIIGYTIGNSDEAKDISDVNSIINSISFQPNNNQDLTNQGNSASVGISSDNGGSSSFSSSSLTTSSSSSSSSVSPGSGSSSSVNIGTDGNNALTSQAESTNNNAGVGISTGP